MFKVWKCLLLPSILLIFHKSSCSSTSNILQVIDSGDYVEKIAEQMVEHLTRDAGKDKLFPIVDCNSTINTKQPGHSAVGNVRFHSGFVESIDVIQSNVSSDTSNSTDPNPRLTANFKLNEVHIVYEVHYELEPDVKSDATFLIRYKNVNFALDITFNYATKRALGHARYDGINVEGHGQWEIKVKSYPNTVPVQLIVHELRTNAEFRQPLMTSFTTNWTTILNTTLNKSIDEIGFPDTNFVDLLN